MFEYKYNKKYPKILNEFLDDLAVEGKSENTIKKYSKWIEGFIKFQVSTINKDKSNKKNIDISNVSNDLYSKIDIDLAKEYRKYLVKNKYASTSVNNGLSACRTFFKYLIEKKIIINNVFLNVKDVKGEERVVDYLTVEEINKLLDYVKSIDTIYAKRDYTIINLMVNIGIRIDELYKLNIDSFNFSNNTVKVLGKGNKQREIPVDKRCIESIKEYLKLRVEFIKDSVDENALFISRQENRLNKETFSSKLKKYGEAVGLYIFPHMLRHTSASIMIQNGVSLEIIQAILGHKQPSTTLIYAKINNKQKQSAVEVLGNVLNNDKENKNE